MANATGGGAGPHVTETESEDGTHLLSGELRRPGAAVEALEADAGADPDVAGQAGQGEHAVGVEEAPVRREAADARGLGSKPLPLQAGRHREDVLLG
jgi:hypothetical protein